MIDKTLALMAGADIPVPECLLVIHLPRIREIAYMGELEFFQAILCLIVNKNFIDVLDKNVLLNLTNFNIFMMIMSDKETADKKGIVLDLFHIMFPKYKITFLPRSILFSIEDHMVTMDENNFDSFQEVIKEMFFFNSSSSETSTYNPADERAAEISKKLMAGRAKIAAERNGSGKGGSIFSLYVSSLTVGLYSMSLNECLELTMYLIFDLVERYNLYTSWDIDIRARLQGAKGEDKPDNWMKNIH